MGTMGPRGSAGPQGSKGDPGTCSAQVGLLCIREEYFWVVVYSRRVF